MTSVEDCNEKSQSWPEVHSLGRPPRPCILALHPGPETLPQFARPRTSSRGRETGLGLSAPSAQAQPAANPPPALSSPSLPRACVRVGAEESPATVLCGKEVSGLAGPASLISMKLLSLVAVVGCLLVPAAQANKSSEDIRCKCICPPYRNINGHIYNQNVSQKDCNCLHVVEPMPVPGHDMEAYCLLCECRYEERSTTTIKVIIVIYLSVVGALLLYMAFLMLVDPLIRKPDAYTEQLHNEEENEDARSVAAAAAALGGPRANTVLERVEGAQQRWKLQVQEQRKTVFDRHKMLS
uniref:Transmembrane protein 9 n=2 Tax=Microcebus murinus TaxID=30608 RepID=A0A8C5XZD7_MICMU